MACIVGNVGEESGLGEGGVEEGIQVRMRELAWR